MIFPFAMRMRAHVDGGLKPPNETILPCLTASSQSVPIASTSAAGGGPDSAKRLIRAGVLFAQYARPGVFRKYSPPMSCLSMKVATSEREILEGTNQLPTSGPAR